MPAADLIRAAGVVLLRQAEATREVLIVHRPHYDDWSLPKGKLKPGEHPIDAAIRECDEETGFQVLLGARLPSVTYPVDGIPKRVDFWTARIKDDEGFSPGSEVDDIRWLSADRARQTLRHDSEADIVELAVSLPETSPLILLRHAAAVKRSDFPGKNDAERPLSGLGRSQAKALVPILSAYGISDIHSSEAARCYNTVKKAAKHLATGVQREPSFSEEGFADRPERTARRMQRLLLDPAPLVICSHRPVLPTLIDITADLLGRTCLSSDSWDVPPVEGAERWDPKMPPGGFIVLHRSFANGSAPSLVSIERHSVTG